MDENYDYLIEILEQSVKKNGVKPLTNEWLLNILKLTREQIEDDDNISSAYEFDPD